MALPLLLLLAGAALGASGGQDRGGGGLLWLPLSLGAAAAFAGSVLTLWAGVGASLGWYTLSLYGSAAFWSLASSDRRKLARAWPGALVGAMAAGATVLRGLALASGPGPAVAPLFATEVAAAALGGVLIGDRLSWPRWLGLACLAAGAALAPGAGHDHDRAASVIDRSQQRFPLAPGC